MRNQLRIAIDNKYDESAESSIPEMAIGIEKDRIAMNAFYDLIKPSFKANTCRPDIDAVLKRASYIVNSKTYFYVKIAASDVVHRIRNVTGSMLTQEAGELYMAFKREGVMPDPADLRHDVDSEQRFLDRLLSTTGTVRRWRRNTLALA